MAPKKRRASRKRRPNAQASQEASGDETIQSEGAASEETSEASQWENDGDSKSPEETAGRSDEGSAADGAANEETEIDPGEAEGDESQGSASDEVVEDSAPEEEDGVAEEEDGAVEESSSEEPISGEEGESHTDEGDTSDAEEGPSLMGEGVEVDESEVEDTEEYLKGLVEALLFSSDKPQTAKEIARAAKIDRGRAQELIDLLVEDNKHRGVRLAQVSDGYAFRTNPTYSRYVREFLAQRPVRLSRAQLETLAIVAYRQPITRPEVDDIRGVDSGAVIKLLLERELIRILGKKDEPGRPMIYGTAPAFLDLFSLNSLRDLPTLREFTELSEDSRAKFELEIGEPAPEGPIELSEESDGENAESAEGEEDSTATDSTDGGESGATNSGDDQDDGHPASDAEQEEGAGDDSGGESPSSDDDPTSNDERPDEADEAEADDAEADDENVPLDPADEEEFPDDEDDDEDEDDDD